MLSVRPQEYMALKYEVTFKERTANPIRGKTSFVMHGSAIAACGSMTSQVTRRRGMTKADIDVLNPFGHCVWKNVHLAPKNGYK